MAGADPRIGGAYFELSVDDKRFASSMASAQATAAKGTESITQSFRKSVGAVTGLIGAFTAVIGVATTFYSIGNKIGEALSGASKAAKELSDSLDFSKPSEALVKVNEDIVAAQNAMADWAAQTTLGKIFDKQVMGVGIDELEKRLADLEKTREQLEASRAKRVAAAEKEATDKAAQAAADRDREANEGAWNFEEEARIAAMQADDAAAAELASTAERAHAEEMQRIDEAGKARIAWAERYRQELESIQREQTRGFGVGDGSFGGLQSALDELVRYSRISAHASTGAPVR